LEENKKREKSGALKNKRQCIEGEIYKGVRGRGRIQKEKENT
jgi:hypothetical protein